MPSFKDILNSKSASIYKPYANTTVPTLDLAQKPTGLDAALGNASTSMNSVKDARNALSAAPTLNPALSQAASPNPFNALDNLYSTSVFGKPPGTTDGLTVPPPATNVTPFGPFAPSSYTKMPAQSGPAVPMQNVTPFGPSVPASMMPKSYTKMPATSSPAIPMQNVTPFGPSVPASMMPTSYTKMPAEASPAVKSPQTVKITPFGPSVPSYGPLLPGKVSGALAPSGQIVEKADATIGTRPQDLNSGSSNDGNNNQNTGTGSNQNTTPGATPYDDLIKYWKDTMANTPTTNPNQAAIDAARTQQDTLISQMRTPEQFQQQLQGTLGDIAAKYDTERKNTMNLYANKDKSDLSGLSKISTVYNPNSSGARSVSGYNQGLQNDQLNRLRQAQAAEDIAATQSIQDQQNREQGQQYDANTNKINSLQSAWENQKSDTKQANQNKLDALTALQTLQNNQRLFGIGPGEELQTVDGNLIATKKDYATGKISSRPIFTKTQAGAFEIKDVNGTTYALNNVTGQYEPIGSKPREFSLSPGQSQYQYDQNGNAVQVAHAGAIIDPEKSALINSGKQTLNALAEDIGTLKNAPSLSDALTGNYKQYLPDIANTLSGIEGKSDKDSVDRKLTAIRQELTAAQTPEERVNVLNRYNQQIFNYEDALNQNSGNSQSVPKA